MTIGRDRHAVEMLVIITGKAECSKGPHVYWAPSSTAGRQGLAEREVVAIVIWITT